MIDTSATSELACRDVSVIFGGLRAVDAVDLTLQKGEIVGLIGPNGAGKSTLVNAITGFQTLSEGSILIDGVDISRLLHHHRARAGVVRTFQSVRLFSGLSVFENLVAGALGRVGTSVREATDRALDVAELIGLTGSLEASAASLPHGLERLVGIGRALAAQPRFLLLDEPAAGLNEYESDELGRVLVAVRERFGCAICVIEHDMRLIMSLSERIVVLESGSVIARGTPAEVQRDPRVVEAYLGTA